MVSERRISRKDVVDDLLEKYVYDPKTFKKTIETVWNYYISLLGRGDVSGCYAQAFIRAEKEGLIIRKHTKKKSLEEEADESDQPTLFR